MKDEEYLFKQDIRQKGSIARSARSKRTHNGRRGRVRLPSDNMTEKELKKMNGEVKSYPLNKPMNWAEFKEMPVDIQHTYIKLLREKFGVPNSSLAEMFGVHHSLISAHLKKTGLPSAARGVKNWDKDGFHKWLAGVREQTEDDVAEEAPFEEESTEENHEPTKCEIFPVRNAIPTSGLMTFEGYTHDIVRTISDLFGKANIHLQIKWDVL